MIQIALMDINTQEKEMYRDISCSCGQWEQFPADMPRNHSQIFDWVKNHPFKNEALYECPDCKSKVWSKSFPKVHEN